MSEPSQKKAKTEVKELCIARPDDFHLHVRDGVVLQSVVPSVACQFARAIIMPNLVPPVATTEMALAYRDRVLAAVPKSYDFIPLMTLYLTDTTTPEEVRKAKQSGHVYAVKLYPAGATTNSDSGVTDIEKCIPTLKAMGEVGLPLLIHGEVTDQDVDVFDRESKFLEIQLPRIIKAAPDLKIVLEHITTKEAVEFVSHAPANIAATITAHHLLFNRTKIFTKGIHPEYYCLPIIKAEEHRKALVNAATSGSPKFFLGTDSAPHPTHKKECCGGSAGCYTSFAAMELYAEAFEAAGCLDKLEGFASVHGASFYGLPTNKSQGRSPLKLHRTPWIVPQHYDLGQDKVTPVKSGEVLQWKCV